MDFQTDEPALQQIPNLMSGDDYGDVIATAAWQSPQQLYQVLDFRTNDSC